VDGERLVRVLLEVNWHDEARNLDIEVDVLVRQCLHGSHCLPVDVVAAGEAGG